MKDNRPAHDCCVRQKLVERTVSERAANFDPERKAIVLAAGDKVGVNQKKFYVALIEKADSRFDQHLGKLKEKRRDNVKIFKRKT